LKAISKGTLYLFTFYLLLSPFPTTLFAQQKAKRIAVLDLQGEGVSKSAAKTLTDRLRSKLVNTGVFHVLERDQMDEILGEQGFQQSGCVSDECLVEIGRLVGVQQMIGGTIGKIGQTYTLDLRIIDVQTGRILKTVSDDYRGAADGLLGILEEAANKIAGKKVKRKVRETSSSTWYYWVGGGIVLAGAAAAILLGGDNGGGGGSDLPGINDDGNIWPPK
jgi:TolB-like protein